MKLEEQQHAHSFLERFTACGEPVHLTGLQALARLILEQVRRDREAGLRVKAYVSGYPGSPLGGFDQLLGHLAPLLEEHDVHFEAGINEELAAAAVAGTQLVDVFPHSDCDGVVGMWYGKAPGVDRCLDVFRHANFTGISHFGGALAVAGDDPGCKSSSLPSASEHAFAHAMMPLLVPEDPADIIELGLHGWALSRYAGLWTGMKLVADLCDGGELVTLPASRPAPVLPSFEVAGYASQHSGQPAGQREPAHPLFRKRLDTRLLPPTVNEIERELVFHRLEAARRYAYANGLDRIVGKGAGDRLGLVVAGRHHRLLRSAFERLGVDASECERLGIRLLRLAMVYPLEARRLSEFADGLDTIIVLDDRRGFLEDQLRASLYNRTTSPLVLGQRDESGAPWLPREGALTAEGLTTELGDFFSRRFQRPEFKERARAQERLQHGGSSPASLERRPHFCSGCPHLTSTRVPDGLAAAAGIGCHTMLILSGGEARYIGAMGSEGAHWNGLSRYVDTPHLFQNVGDGTYFHSARLSIRSSVAAGSRITFKLLWNGAIAMTGGQTSAGQKPLVAVVRDLLSDGVQRIVAMSDDSELRALARENERVDLIPRERSQDAMRLLAEQDGVTVFIYDEICANEKQRRQKRGLHPAPRRRIYINTDVCEGCGDCGSKSACLSVHPIDTALGRKTRIHQGTCAQDETCLEGDCPAFLTLDADTEIAPLGVPADLSPPDSDPLLPPFEDDYRVLLIGVGSTGVVTVDALLVEAARIQGHYAAHIDQIGLSQRGGRVASHFRLSRRPIESSAHVPWGGADTLLAFDPLGASDSAGLVHLSSDRTHCVMHSCVSPTAQMVSNPESHRPTAEALADRLRSRTRQLDSLPAEELCIALFGTHLSANVMLLGYAFQCSALPLPSTALEGAIRALGVAVDANLAAFRAGRAFRLHPEQVAAVLRRARPLAIGEDGSPEQAGQTFPAEWARLAPLLAGAQGTPASGDPGSGRDAGDAANDSDAWNSLTRRVAGWALDLADYQNSAWGKRYLSTLLPLVEAELSQYETRETRETREGSDGRLSLTAVAARELYRLMAYKDEYEVARLHLRSPFRRWLDERSGGRVKPVYWLHPPLLRDLGLRRKLELGHWVEVGFRALASLRFLRGTAFDPFGRTAARRLERDLIRWYEDLLATLVARSESLSRTRALEVAESAALIRGYEEIKRRGAAQAKEKADKLLNP